MKDFRREANSMVQMLELFASLIERSGNFSGTFLQL
jgi:hypothetical protein